MAKQKPDPYLVNEENPEWTEDDFKKARPANEVLREILGPEAADMIVTKKPGRVRGSGTKQAQTIRFDVEIISAFKATGKGWQTRMNDALREWLKEHPMNHA